MGQYHHIERDLFSGGGGVKNLSAFVFLLCELQFASVKLHILKAKALKKPKLYFSRS